MDIEKVAGDAALKSEGVWVDYTGTDWRFKICSANAKKAQLKIRNAMSRASKKLRNPTDLPQEMSAKLTLEWIANVIVKDWENVTTKGSPIPYSPEALISMIEDNDMPEVADFISNAARDVTLFGGEVLDGANSEGSPATAALKSGAPVGA